MFCEAASSSTIFIAQHAVTKSHLISYLCISAGLACLDIQISFNLIQILVECFFYSIVYFLHGLEALFCIGHLSGLSAGLSA